MKVKEKKCKFCGVGFFPTRSTLQSVCSLPCSLKLAENKRIDAEVKTMKETIKTRTDYLNILQKLFNTFVRLRDKDSLCISCNSELGVKYDAGHYFSVGAFPGLRFNEYNVHGQCVSCNQHKHGNLINYGELLPLRIGSEKVIELKEKRNDVLKLTILDIKNLIRFYRHKIKEYGKV